MEANYVVSMTSTHNIFKATDVLRMDKARVVNLSHVLHSKHISYSRNSVRSGQICIIEVETPQSPSTIVLTDFAYSDPSHHLIQNTQSK